MIGLRVLLGSVLGLLGFLVLNVGLLYLSLLMMAGRGDTTVFVYLFWGLLFLGIFVLSWPDYREFSAFFSRDTAQKFCAVGLELSLSGALLLNGFLALAVVDKPSKMIFGIILQVMALALNSTWLYGLFRPDGKEKASRNEDAASKKSI